MNSVLRTAFICSSGFADANIREQHNLVPNPAQNTVRIDYTAAAAGATLEVYDMTGRLISSYITPDSNGS